MSDTIDNAQRLKDLEKRIKSIQETKTGAEAEYKVLKKQYEGEVEKLKELGVENLKDLNKVIEEKKVELEEVYNKIEDTLDDLEGSISTLEEENE